MSKLKIYRASAGSGKTYTLTREFIFLLFKNPFDYKHTLAVTFTNKATAEMKNRILETIYSIMIKSDKEFLNKLAKQEGSIDKVISKASLILFLLLHDFSRFTVSTIDSFFQRIIRSFVQELGLQNNFKTELNSQKILKLAVDRLIMKLGQKDKKDLRDWLILSTKENMEQGQNWNLSTKLYDLGREIYSEKFQSFHREFIQQISDKETIDCYKSDLKEIIESFESTIKEYGENGLKLLKTHNLKWEDFPGKSRTPLKILEKMAELDNKFSDTIKIKEWIDNPDAWLRDKKDVHLSSRVYELYQGGLNKLLEESTTLIDDKIRLYNTSIIINKQFNALGIINDIAKEVDEICKEEMVYLLANSNKLLNKVIDNNECPFIFEKSGNTIKHFMIDEFQDTSSLQWNNFRPLINNSLASNNYSLLVGDVKQSIYRWRSSDWELLANQVKRDFEHVGTIEETLDTNWRSYENIITFNNSLFVSAVSILQKDLNDTLDEFNFNSDNNEMRSVISDAYSDVIQNTAAKNIGSGGSISLEFIESENTEDYSEKAVEIAIKEIESSIANGIELKDICVLVRKKNEAKLITNALLSGEYSSKPYSVVSNEALVLSGSIAVNMVINQLKYILDPSKTIQPAYISFYHQLIAQEEYPLVNDSSILLAENNTELKNEILAHKGLPLLDLIETLIQKLPKQRHIEEGVFLQALVDLTTDFIKSESADLASFIEWWDTDGQLKSISIPEDQNAIRVMTVHKSKGLEFDVVVMPFLNWELDELRHREILWCEDPLNKLDNIPVQYSKNLSNTLFVDYYTKEHMHRYVDNLNLLYVAFTRAKKSLYGIAPELNKKGNLKLISDLLFLSIQGNVFANSIKDKINNQEEFWDDNKFFAGKRPQVDNEIVSSNETCNNDTEFTTCSLPTLQTWNYSDRVSIVMDSSEFMTEETANQINKGKIMHHLFELIHTPDDISTSIKQLHLEGVIPEKQMGSLEREIQEVLNHKTVKNWFKPGLKILNETSIITPKGTYIPDRVIMDKNSVIVIDYKFGEVKSAGHLRQVNNYIHLIRQMGYKSVEGYIWYVNENDIVDVTKPQNLTLF